MNYLTLVQKLRSKCRVTGSGPTSLTGQSAEFQRLIDFTNEAWLSIQRRRTDWRWMRKSATAITVQGQPSYSPTTDFNLTDFGYWAIDFESGDTFRNYLTSAGTNSEIFMSPIDYDRWRDVYLYGANRQAYSRPLEFSVTPNNAIACGPIPVVGYTLTGDYYSVPTEMVSAGDTPGMPVQFHWAIIYKAMMIYGTSESAPEIYDEGENEFRAIMAKLEDDQLRRMTLGGALA